MSAVAAKSAGRVARDLRSALDIRHGAAGFEALARELHLVSMNSQLSAARLGNAGSAFRVLAVETARISEALSRMVVRIRDFTGKWARESAVAMASVRRLALIDRVSVKGSHAAQRFGAAGESIQSRLADYEDESVGLTRAMSSIADDMNKSLRLITYITSNILIEGARLDDAVAGKDTLKNLASQMQGTATRIREIAADTVAKLDHRQEG